MKNHQFYFERHLKLWEEQNRLVKRLTVGTIVFAVVLTVRVLDPFSAKLLPHENVQARITALASAIEKSRALQAALVRFEQALVEVRDNISLRPWFQEKEKLINKLAAIRQTAPDGGTREQFHAAADETIRTIGDLIVSNVIVPLEKALLASESQPRVFADLAENLEALRDIVAEYDNCIGLTAPSPTQGPIIIQKSDTVTTTVRLNIRKGAPNTQAPIYQVVQRGTKLTYAGVIEDGEPVNGNPVWYADDTDNFFWSGGVRA